MAKLRPPLPAEIVYKAAKRTVFIAGATLRVSCGAEVFWFESPFQKRTKLISSLDIGDILTGYRTSHLSRSVEARVGAPTATGTESNGSSRTEIGTPITSNVSPSHVPILSQRPDHWISNQSPVTVSRGQGLCTNGHGHRIER